MQSKGKGVCKLLLAAGVVSLLSGAHAQDDGDALPPAGDEFSTYDGYDDSAAVPLSYEEPTDDADVGDDGDVVPYGEVEETDPYAEEEAADPYAEVEETDPYTGEEETDPYAAGDEATDGAVEPFTVDGDAYGEYGEPPSEEEPVEEEDDGEEDATAPLGEDPFEYGDALADAEEYGEGPQDADAYAEGPAEVAEGPAAVEGPAEADELDFEGFTAYPGQDYIPSFEAAVLSQNIGGSLVANQNECAAACQADPECNAASYYLDPSAYGDRNCFTKTLSIPCELPPDAPSVDGAVLLLQTTECDIVDLPPYPAPEPEIVEVPEMADAPVDIAPMDVAPMDVAPVTVAPRAFTLDMAPGPASGSLEALMYYAYPSVDYVSKDMPPNLVSVANTAKPSSFVTDMAACAMACDADQTCNAASFYSDASVYGGNNCWLKTIGDPCELPADAQADPEATLLLKQDTCPALGAVAPAVAVEPSISPMPLEMTPGAVEPAVTPGTSPDAVTPAEGPGPAGTDTVTDRGIGLATPPTETIDGGSDSSASPVTPDSAITDADSAVSLQSAAAAVVAAVGIALLA